MLEKLKNIAINRKKEVIVFIFLILGLSIFFIGSAFAALTPVNSITITSKNSSYENNDSGAWKIEKSAKWIYKGKTRVSFEADTTVMSGSDNTDVIMVLDVSNSMSSSNKLENLKQSSIELIENLLSNTNNNVSLISFADDYNILSSFSSDKDMLINQINSLQIAGSTSYYQALVGVDTVLKDYVKQDNRDVVVLFVSGGYPNADTPNQISQYKYLKEEYPYITINAIQYEFGKEILNSIKEISDYQFLANSNTLSSVLADASAKTLSYDQFQIIDYIDNRYFNLESVDDVTVSQGKVELEYENAKQKIIWTIDNLKSGDDVKLTMDINLKSEYVGEGGVYPTNVSTEVITKIGDKEENITSTETPSLAEGYSVIYEGNAPDGTSVNNVPDGNNYSAFETASISTDEPTCDGYEFKGWEIVTEGVTRIGDDYFIMPASDVVLRAKWSKVEIAKSMDGTVSTQGEPVMKGQDWWNTDYEKEKVTSIEVKTSTGIPDTAIAYWDASQAQDNSVVAYIEDDGNGDYKVSIGGLGGVIANSDCYNLFSDFTMVKTINLDNFDTSSVTNMSNMFYNCLLLSNLNISKFNTSNVTTIQSMFNNCKSLATLDLRNFDTINVDNMRGVFYNCENLTNLDLSSFNTSKVTNMSSMFQSCVSLTTLDLNGFDTLLVVNMASMFQNCSNLINLDVSTFNTLHVIDMSNMFYNCNDLIDLDLNGFNTFNVTTMSGMFSNCCSLTSLDLNSFNTSNVINMAGMFGGCSGLLNLNLSTFNTSKVNIMTGMFSQCNQLSYINLGSFDTSSVTHMDSMFSGCSSLISLDLQKFDTSNVTNMSSMFNGCSNLTSLEVSNFDTSNVTNMNSMFFNCKGLTSLDATNFDTSNVINMSSMFYSCSNLKELNLSNFNTSKVTNMYGMFYSCSSLTNLDVSNFDTSNVTNMDIMFYSCSSLTNLDVSNFDTSNVTSMSNMFSGCSSLTNLDVSNFDTSNVANMQSMFVSCSSLENLDISNFSTKNVINMSFMFNGCSSLTSLDVSNFDTSSVTNMRGMFQGCSNLINLQLSSFNTSQVTDMYAMFNSCSRLLTIDMRNAEFNAITYQFMFNSTNSTVNIIVKDSTAQSWIRLRLDEAGRPNATVTIAESVDAGVDGESSTESESSLIFDSTISTSDDFGSNINFRVEELSDVSSYTPLPLRYGVSFKVIRWL